MKIPILRKLDQINEDRCPESERVFLRAYTRLCNGNRFWALDGARAGIAMLIISRRMVGARLNLAAKVGRSATSLPNRASAVSSELL
jgi:hypothetical protein